MTMFHEITRAKNELEALQRDYLKRWGWNEVCNNPGSYWLWMRDFADIDAQYKARDEEHNYPTKHTPYGVMRVPMNLAISMTTRCLDEQPELSPDND